MNDSDFKQMVRQSFDQAAVGYDHPSMRFFDGSAEHLVRQLSLRGDERVLDAACGTGKVALQLAKCLPRGCITAMDLSEGMLQQARRKAQATGISNVSFEQGDLTQARWPKASFDGITCSFGVFFWTDMEGTLASLLQAVRPGGFVAITSFLSGAFLPLSKLLLDRFERYGVQLPKTYSWERLDHPDKHRSLFQKVGLQEIQSHNAPMGYFLASPEDWWHLVLHSGFRGFYNQLSSDQVIHYQREHLGEIKSLAVSEGIELRVPVIFTVGRLAYIEEERL